MLFTYDLFKTLDGGIILSVYIYIMLFILGACLGSFLTCFADRYLSGESIIKGRSHCDHCQHTLVITDLVPIFAFIVHKGKCKYCGAKLTKKYQFTEIMMGIAFILPVLQYGLSLKALSLIIIFCLLLPASLIDIKTMEIPDRFFIGILIVWGLTLLCNFSINSFLDSIYGGICVAAGIFILSLLLDKILGKETLGFGDVKLFMATGLCLGLVLSILNVIMTCIIGMIVILILKRRDRPTPLGPSLAGAFFITSLFGHYAADAYMQLMV